MADSFTITGQKELLALDDAGNAVKSMEVNFTTVPSGITASETIPVSQYSTAHVHDLLTKRAQEIEAVHAL